MMRLKIISLGFLFIFLNGINTYAQDDRYWEWGWGIYNGVRQAQDSIIALFDWSLINFGSIAVDEEAVTSCNTILSINPNHKFVIRVWPILHIGDCPENNYQATMFHYFYQEGIREAVLAETRRQIRWILDGISNPESVVGMCFLEELPMYFSSNPFSKWTWQEGDPLPWDIAHFSTEIEADLGEPFNMMDSTHRVWWGEKYCQVLGEIHRVMKEESGGKIILYWQDSGMYTIDHLLPGETILNRESTMPLYYNDIVKDSVCDGIFGYPNSDWQWEFQTLDIVNEFDYLFFSQLSVPGGMRITSWETTVERVLVDHPNNLGTFVFIWGESGTTNLVPWMKPGEEWTIEEHALMIATLYDISLAIEANTWSVDITEGSTAELELKLNMQPEEEIMISVSRTSGDSDISILDGSELSFTTSNWDTSQTVTIFAAEDADANDDTATITCSGTGFPTLRVSVNEIDNFSYIQDITSDVYRLLQNHPNPFTSETTIIYELPEQDYVDLSVFNLSGQRIRMLVSEQQSAGSHSVIWDGKDEKGNEVASGLYFYRIETPHFRYTRKMTLLR